MNRFNKICKDIKEVKIQGAENIAIATLKALKINNSQKSIKKLLSLRPTEPAIQNAINYAIKTSYDQAIKYLKDSRPIISKNGAQLIKNGDLIYTHCHSNTVIRIIKEAQKQKKKITVNHTETRPLYQGRKTAQDLSKLKIPNNHFIDSAMRLAIKKSNIILLGADSISINSIINKIGSELVCDTAQHYKIPVYICTNSWKFDPQSIYKQETPIEKRPTKEIWTNPPKYTKIINPAFEIINPKLIKGIITEKGIFTHKKFIKYMIKKELI